MTRMTNLTSSDGPVRGGAVESASVWIYEGVWGGLSSLLRTPREAPNLPVAPGEDVVAIKPSLAWLRYLKFWFWIVLVIIDALIIGAWLIVCFVQPVVGAALALPAWALAILPDIVAYIAIHLRYDTTWYVISPSSIRLRNGIWTIRETTFTFENVQNVEITQGPIERWFGIANLKVETAGGGMVHTQHGPIPDGSNMAYLFGLQNAGEMRELIMSRVSRSKSTGLGDDETGASGADGTASSRAGAGVGWSAEHLDELRAIRDRLKRALG